MSETVLLRDLQIGDTGWLIQRHAELYAQDEGFDIGFEVLVAEVLVAFHRQRDMAVDRAFIAEDGQGRRLGSVFCVRLGDETAKLRLFLLEPEARGRGLGRRLLEACIDHARACGFQWLTLWTHARHRAACGLYRARGFVLKQSRPVRSFGQDLVEQQWVLKL